MKKKLTIFIKTQAYILLGVLFMTACEKSEPVPQPVAGFSFEPNNVSAPSSIQFTNQSTNAVSYIWDFGDNSSSSNQMNPSHTYTEEGEYTVTLTATGEDGGTDMVQKTVGILAPPEPEAVFSMSTLTAEAPAEIIFTNESLHADTYIWEFGDGASSTDQDPVHIFEDPGVYSITLTAKGPGGSNTTTKDLTITMPVNIFPGESAAGYALKETWASVKDKFDERGINYTQYGPLIVNNVIIHPLEVESEGIFYYFISLSASFTLNGEDQILMIVLSDPFAGVTEKQIGLGSALSEVGSAYGPPERHDTESYYYRYYSLGVNYRYDPATELVDRIVIFTASDSSGRMMDPIHSIRLEMEELGF